MSKFLYSLGDDEWYSSDKYNSHEEALEAAKKEADDLLYKGKIYVGEYIEYPLSQFINLDPADIIDNGLDCAGGVIHEGVIEGFETSKEADQELQHFLDNEFSNFLSAWCEKHNLFLGSIENSKEYTI